MAYQKIYLVGDEKTEDVPRAVFDCKEKALQYTNRFKTNREYTIFEQVLNPPFKADPDRMPFEIAFCLDGEIRINRGDKNEEDIERAVANGYENESVVLYCYTLAKDESDALINAMEIRDRAIEEGEWQQLNQRDDDDEI